MPRDNHRPDTSRGHGLDGAQVRKAFGLISEGVEWPVDSTSRISMSPIEQELLAFDLEQRAQLAETRVWLQSESGQRAIKGVITECKEAEIKTPPTLTAKQREMEQLRLQQSRER